MTNWTRGQSVTLKRNPYYRGPGPSLGEVRLLQFSNPDAAVQALRSGETDYMTDVPINQMKALGEEPNIVAKPFQSYRTVYLGFSRDLRIALRANCQRAGAPVRRIAT
ncbi:ABC transporter substrate-binding protein [Mesorhizobium sp.]|uniref:ABC transporter substrate-binding protein n=1 Tax=Mesorhizobium sp. TaxID=1871066 RepID=UPI00257B6C58|nr:ABC transporter substrate-binding protein [Mesorhizobium sp.]